MRAIDVDNTITLCRRNDQYIELGLMAASQLCREDENLKCVVRGMQGLVRVGFLAHACWGPAWHRIMHAASSTIHCLHQIRQSPSKRSYTYINPFLEKNVHEGHLYRGVKKYFRDRFRPSMPGTGP
jgi:hypothetical protein